MSLYYQSMQLHFVFERHFTFVHGSATCMHCAAELKRAGVLTCSCDLSCVL